MYKLITLIVLIAIAFVAPVISISLLAILVALAYYTQSQGTATIASTMVIIFRWLGITWGHATNITEATVTKVRIIDADNTVHRIELGMELDSKAIPAFKTAVAEVDAKYAADAVIAKEKLAASLAKLEAAKAKAKAAAAK
jgi:hypothetical protein